MSKLMKSLQKFMKKPYLVIGCIVILVAVACGSAAYLTHVNSTAHEAATVTKQRTTSATRLNQPSDVTKPTTESPPPAPQPSATPPTPQTQTQKAISPLQPSKKPTPAQESALTVKSISVYNPPHPVCDSSQGPMALFQSAYLMLSPASGAVQWQVEKRIDGAVSIGTSGSFVASSNELTHELKNLYSYQLVPGENALRLHVTSPNDISTQWYVIAPGTGCS